MSLSKPIKPQGRRARRDYTAQFKSQMVLACRQPGASIAAIAQAHEVNGNVLHRWVREHLRLGWHSAPGFLPIGVKGQEISEVGSESDSSIETNGRGPLKGSTQDIEIICRRGQTEVSIRWPVSTASQCAEWLKDWLK